ncbi:conserved Plasmodium protein, unknown function [Plasmodium relictum]|uniref:Mon2/Sec7/BIG1-like dimerisation and cyclophilin-binding domain-containing protein n=1 Tax=Plasmodium relictum TaxID=85471 RepID=A0A1J1HA60_PLARL|nr:conserved Plasmodium protein, unknown function [Plasmodium relictum]CRH01400.1 conserved Plasmodium protein, unknown function [Plasmodium relictum]
MDPLLIFEELENDLKLLIIETKKKNICIKDKIEITTIKIKNYKSILKSNKNCLLNNFEFPLNEIIEIVNISININSHKIICICLLIIQRIVFYILYIIDNRELIKNFKEINIEKHIEIITNKLFDLTFIGDTKILIKILQIILTAFSPNYIEYYNKDNINTLLKILYSIYYSSLYENNHILYKTCCATYEQLLNSLIDICNKENQVNLRKSSHISKGKYDSEKKKKKNDENYINFYYENYDLHYNTNTPIDLIYINDLKNINNVQNKDKLLSLIHYLCYCCFINIRSKYNSDINSYEKNICKEKEKKNFNIPNEKFKSNKNTIDNDNDEFLNNEQKVKDNYKSRNMDSKQNYVDKNSVNNYLYRNFTDKNKKNPKNDHVVENITNKEIFLHSDDKCSLYNELQSNSNNEAFSKKNECFNDLEEKKNICNEEIYNKENRKKEENNNISNIKNSNIKKLLKILKNTNHKNGNENSNSLKFNENFDANSSESKTEILSSYNRNNLILPLNFCLDLLYIFLNNYENFLHNSEFFKILKFEIIYIILISLKNDLHTDIFFRCLKIFKIICDKYFQYFLGEIKFIFLTLIQYLCLNKPHSKLYIVLNFFFYLFDNTLVFYFLYKYFFYENNDKNTLSKNNREEEKRNLCCFMDGIDYNSIYNNLKEKSLKVKHKNSCNLKNDHENINLLNNKNKDNKEMNENNETNCSMNNEKIDRDIKNEKIYNLKEEFNEEGINPFVHVNYEKKNTKTSDVLNSQKGNNDINDHLFTKIVEYISKIVHELLFLHSIDITKIYVHLKVFKYDRIYTSEKKMDHIIEKIKTKLNYITKESKIEKKENETNVKEEEGEEEEEEEKKKKKADKKIREQKAKEEKKEQKEISFFNFFSYPVILPNNSINPREDFYLCKFSTEKKINKILFDDLFYKDVDEIRLLASSVDNILSIIHSFYIIFLNILKKSLNQYCYATIDLNDEKNLHSLNTHIYNRNNSYSKKSNTAIEKKNSNKYNFKDRSIKTLSYRNTNEDNLRFNRKLIRKIENHDNFVENSTINSHNHRGKQANNISHISKNENHCNGEDIYDSQVNNNKKDLYKCDNKNRDDYYDEHKSLFFLVFNSSCRYFISSLCLIFSYTNKLDLCFFNGFQKLIFISTYLKINICTDAILQTLTKCSSIFTLENSPFFLKILKNYEKQENKNDNNMHSKKNKTGSKTNFKITNLYSSSGNKAISFKNKENDSNNKNQISRSLHQKVIPDICMYKLKKESINDNSDKLKIIKDHNLKGKDKYIISDVLNNSDKKEFENTQEAEVNSNEKINLDHKKKEAYEDKNKEEDILKNELKEKFVDHNKISANLKKNDFNLKKIKKNDIVNNVYELNEINKKKIKKKKGYGSDNSLIKESFSKRLSIESFESNFISYKSQLNEDLLNYFDEIINRILKESYYISNDLNNLKYILSIKAIISIFYIYGDNLDFNNWLKVMNLFVEINYIYKYIASIENKKIEFLNFFHHINKNEEEFVFSLSKNLVNSDKNNLIQNVDSKSIEFCYFILRFIQKNPVLCAEITVIFSSFSYFFKNTVFYNIFTLINIINSIHFMIFNQFFKQKILIHKEWDNVYDESNNEKYDNFSSLLYRDKKKELNKNITKNNNNGFSNNDDINDFTDFCDRNNRKKKKKYMFIKSKSLHFTELRKYNFNEINKKKNVIIEKYIDFIYRNKDIFEIFYFYLSYFDPTYLSYFTFYSNIYFLKKDRKINNERKVRSLEYINFKDYETQSDMDNLRGCLKYNNSSNKRRKKHEYIVLKKLEKCCIFEDFYPLYMLEMLCVINITRIEYIYNNCCINILLLSLCKNNDIQKKSIDTLFNIIKESVIHYKHNFFMQFQLFKPFFFFIVNPYASYRSYFITSFLNFIRKNASFFDKHIWLFIIFLLHVSFKKELKEKDLKKKSDADINQIMDISISNINNIFNILEIIIVDYIEDIPICKIMEVIIHMLILFSSLNFLSNNTSFRAINFSWSIVDYIINCSDLLRENTNDNKKSGDENINDNKKFNEENKNDETNMKKENILLHVCLIENKKIYICDNEIKMKNIKMKSFFIFILNQLMKLCFDERIEVRNCSIKTIMSILSTHICKFDFFFYKTSICMLLKKLSIKFFYKLQEYFELEKNQELPIDKNEKNTDKFLQNSQFYIKNNIFDIQNNNEIFMEKDKLNENKENKNGIIKINENSSKKINDDLIKNKNVNNDIHDVNLKTTTIDKKKNISNMLKEEFRMSFINLTEEKKKYITKRKKKKNRKRNNLFEEIDNNLTFSNKNAGNFLEGKNYDLYDYVNENFNKIIIHHSRDSKLKQWIESFILIIEGCNRILEEQKNYKKIYYFYDTFVNILKKVLFIEYNSKHMFELHISILQILNNIFISKISCYNACYFNMKNSLANKRCIDCINIFDKSFFLIYDYVYSLKDTKIKEFIVKLIIENFKIINSDKWIYFNTLMYLHMFHLLFCNGEIILEKKEKKNYLFLNYDSVLNKLYFDYFISNSSYLNNEIEKTLKKTGENNDSTKNILIDKEIDKHNKVHIFGKTEEKVIEKKEEKNVEKIENENTMEKKKFKNYFTFEYKANSNSYDPYNIHNFFENNKNKYNINSIYENFESKNIYKSYLNNDIDSDKFIITKIIFQTLEYDHINLLINEELLGSIKLLLYHLSVNEEEMSIYMRLVNFLFNDRIFFNENCDEIIDKIKLNDTYNKLEMNMNTNEEREENKECNRLFTLNYKKLYPLNNYIENFQMFKIRLFMHFTPCHVFFIHNKFNLYPNYRINLIYSIIFCNFIRQGYSLFYQKENNYLLISLINMFPYIIATHLKCFLNNLNNNSCFVFYESIIILLKLTYNLLLNVNFIPKHIIFKYWCSIIFSIEQILFVDCNNDKIDMLDIMLIKFIRNNYLIKNSIAPLFIKIYLTKIISELNDKKRRAFSSWTLQILFEEYEKMTKENYNDHFYTTFITLTMLKKCVMTLKVFSSENNEEKNTDEILFILYEMKKLKCSYSYFDISNPILKGSEDKAHLFICYPYLLDCLNTENKKVFITIKELLKLISYPLCFNNIY